MEAITIAEGPVIPEIIGTLVPSIPATRHNIIAPHMPALAPNPVATPNASACGSAIIAALTPPKISPISTLSFNFISSPVIIVLYYHKCSYEKSFWSLCYNSAMKLNEIYGKEDGLKISFEVFPPKGGELEYPNLLKELNCLEKYNPALVSLTWGASGNNNNSFELIKILNEKYNLMPHLTCFCNNFTNIEELINNIKDCNIDNILALRGDKPQAADVFHSDFHYANELVRFIKTKSSLSVAVAGYPEGHIEALNLASDIDNLKKKVDEGAEAIYTQLFFDNEKFFRYMELVRKAGINIPVIPGIMPVISMKQILRMVSMAKITIPTALMQKFEQYENSPLEMRKFGVDFASLQCSELIAAGVKGLHFFTLNKAASTSQILDNIL